MLGEIYHKLSIFDVYRKFDHFSQFDLKLNYEALCFPTWQPLWRSLEEEQKSSFVRYLLVQQRIKGRSHFSV